jgi:hypothetical protein
MLGLNNRTLWLKFFTLTILIACLIFFLNSKTQALLGATQSQAIVVSADSQPDAPLHISSIEVSVSRPNIADPDFEQAKVTAVITNVGSMPVSAFAISHGSANTSNKSGVMFLNIMSLNEALQPGQSKTYHIVSLPLKPVADGLNLAVDYTEFTDGTTWGPDKFNVAQKLAGQRAGARAAKAHFRGLLKKGGPTAVMYSLGEDNTTTDEDISIPRGNSRDWEDGFHTGYKVSRNRLRSAQTKGEAEFETELQKPYDASERRHNR